MLFADEWTKFERIRSLVISKQSFRSLSSDGEKWQQKHALHLYLCAVHCLWPCCPLFNTSQFKQDSVVKSVTLKQPRNTKCAQRSVLLLYFTKSQLNKTKLFYDLEYGFCFSEENAKHPFEGNTILREKGPMIKTSSASEVHVYIDLTRVFLSIGWSTNPTLDYSDSLSVHPAVHQSIHSHSQRALELTDTHNIDPVIDPAPADQYSLKWHHCRRLGTIAGHCLCTSFPRNQGCLGLSPASVLHFTLLTCTWLQRWKNESALGGKKVFELLTLRTVLAIDTRLHLMTQKHSIPAPGIMQHTFRRNGMTWIISANVYDYNRINSKE